MRKRLEISPQMRIARNALTGCTIESLQIEERHHVDFHAGPRVVHDREAVDDRAMVAARKRLELLLHLNRDRLQFLLPAGREFSSPRIFLGKTRWQTARRL